MNFGQLLRGDRMTISDYKLEVGKDVSCQELCTKEVDAEGVIRAMELIDDEYRVEWYVE